MRVPTREFPVKLETRTYDWWGKAYSDAVSATTHEFGRLEATAETRGFEVRVVPRD